MSSRARRVALRGTPDVDVTAFLSLMVMLVPFLLITAVFSRMTILELEAGSDAQAQRSGERADELQVIVRNRFFEVSYGQEATVRIERTESGGELDSLAALLGRLKANYPQTVNATILLEPDVTYEVLVHVMDVVRLRQHAQGQSVESTELFPNISLGSAELVDKGTHVRR